jgi:hypothetical protein
MLAILIATLAFPGTRVSQPTLAALIASPSTRSALLQANEEYEQRKAAAGEEVTKLWDLYLWCKTKSLEKEGRSTLRAILKVDRDHKDANEAVGNVSFDGKWFPSQKKVDEYKKEKEEKEAKEKGLVRYQEGWVPKEDLPFLLKGLAKNEQGEWVDAEAEKTPRPGQSRRSILITARA